MEGYYCNDFFAPQPKGDFQSETEPKSSKTVVIPVITIETNNLKEEMASMLQKLTEESEEKEARIKLHEDKISKLTRKLEKWLTQSVIKDLKSEQELKSSNSEASDEEVRSKKGDKLKND